MAVGKPNDDKRGVKRFLKFLDRREPVEKKISVAEMGFFRCIRFKKVPSILERMLPKKPSKNMIFIVPQQIDQALPAEEAGRPFRDAGHQGKMAEGLERVALGQGLCPCVPCGFIPNF